ncbi:hypothetical protein [Chelatococcus asaccharovorans]|uniref:Uncharacterized protein n=1 Tax=Chelatococcus asaccharovorans TaxID=28210 RepID=A0A2V3UAW3_9HYPH|nr:hypothetical protein [Chelatococcus asaccharovorans]MBS7705572.1 hypothetical protein [Chelatococcus asaccharovorans]PXW60018.1 hypothetical protein C7450_10468 [Chelatococcus asaccharovorans]
MSTEAIIPTTVDAEVFRAAEDFLTLDQFKCRASNGALNAVRSIDNETVFLIHIARKNYFREWKYELSCSINWKIIYSNISILGGNFNERQWKNRALISTGTSKASVYRDWGDNRFSFTKIDDASYIIGNMREFYNKICVPFFEKWNSFEISKNEFYNHSKSAEDIVLLRRDLSLIAISIAIIKRDVDIDELIENHRLYLAKINESSVDVIDDFVGRLRDAGLL